jgi:hypothetical protein
LLLKGPARGDEERLVALTVTQDIANGTLSRPEVSGVLPRDAPISAVHVCAILRPPTISARRRPHDFSADYVMDACNFGEYL